MTTQTRALRPAEAEDVQVGAVIWYEVRADRYVPVLVEEVINPNDPYKAYTADDGCRYGLDGAMVEVREDPVVFKGSANQLIKARAKMERAILTAVQSIISDFETETGLTPSSIYVGTEEIREFGRDRSKYVVTDVETSVNI